jgi:hypothetical protein
LAASAASDVTGLLLAWRSGDRTAQEELAPLVYAELRRRAHRQIRRERSGHTLQTTALVNEANLRLVDSNRVRWQNQTAEAVNMSPDTVMRDRKMARLWLLRELRREAAAGSA